MDREALREKILTDLKIRALANPDSERITMVVAICATLGILGMVCWGIGALFGLVSPVGWIVGVGMFVVVGGGYLWNAVWVYREVFSVMDVKRSDVERVAKRWRL